MKDEELRGVLKNFYPGRGLRWKTSLTKNKNIDINKKLLSYIYKY